MKGRETRWRPSADCTRLDGGDGGGAGPELGAFALEFLWRHPHSRLPCCRAAAQPDGLDCRPWASTVCGAVAVHGLGPFRLAHRAILLARQRRSLGVRQDAAQVLADVTQAHLLARRTVKLENSRLFYEFDFLRIYGLPDVLICYLS